MAHTNRKFITIYTDASVDQKSGICGYGAWIKWGKGHGEKKELSGVFQLDKPCSTLAELTAIYIAVKHTVTFLDTTHTTLACVTDSLNAIKILKHNEKSSYSEFRKKVLGILPPHTTFSIKKVKAHSDKDGARSWVNNRCDELAKEQMRTHRDKWNALQKEK